MCVGELPFPLWVCPFGGISKEVIMSDQISVNDNLVLLVGKSASGKSRSLKNLKNPEGVLYLNCESGKKLPFKSGFLERTIARWDVLPKAFQWAETQPNIHTIVVDSLTYYMDMVESQLVLTSSNTQAAWGQFAQQFKHLMQVLVATSTKNVIFLAHTKDEVNDDMVRETCVPVKGALKNQGIESYFSLVIACKKVKLTDLEEYQNGLLHINEREEMLGYKHVYQTQVTKNTINERLRGPEDLFDIKETFIDNDTQLVLDRLHEYYA